MTEEAEPVEEDNPEEEAEASLSWDDKVLKWLAKEGFAFENDLTDYFANGSAIVDLLRKIGVPEVRLYTSEMVCYKFFLIAQRMLHGVQIRFTFAETQGIMKGSKDVLMQVLLRIYHHAHPDDFQDLDQGQKEKLFGYLNLDKEVGRQKKEYARRIMTLNVTQSLENFDTLLESTKKDSEEPKEDEEIPVSKEETQKQVEILDKHLPAKKMEETQTLIKPKKKKKKIPKRKGPKLPGPPKSKETTEQKVKVDTESIIKNMRDRREQNRSRNLELWKKEVLQELDRHNIRARQVRDDTQLNEKFFQTMELDRQQFSNTVEVTDVEISLPEKTEEPKEEETIEKFDNEIELMAQDYLANRGDWCWDFVNDLSLLKPVLEPILSFANRPSPLPPPRTPETPMEVSIIGAPFSGRQTQAVWLSRKWAIPVISVQAIITKAIESFENRNEDEDLTEEQQLGEKIKQSLEENPNRVSTEVYSEAFIGYIKKLKSEDNYRGYVVHDFPRDSDEAKVADSQLASKSRKQAFEKVFNLLGDDFQQRTADMLIDPVTNHSFNLIHNQPIEEEVESRLISIPKEQVDMHEQVQSIDEIKAHYEASLVEIDASQSVQEIHATILNEFEELGGLPTHVRHQDCVTAKTMLEGLQREYEKRLKKLLQQIRDCDLDLQAKYSDKIVEFRKEVHIERKQKDQAVLELQVNWNDLTAEERSSPDYSQLMDSKLRELNGYIWHIFMIDIQSAGEKISKLCDLNLKAYLCRIQACLNSISSLEISFKDVLREFLENLKCIDEHKCFPLVKFKVEEPHQKDQSLQEISDSMQDSTPLEQIFKNRILTLQGYFEKKTRHYEAEESKLEEECNANFEQILNKADSEYRSVISNFEDAVKVGGLFSLRTDFSTEI